MSFLGYFLGAVTTFMRRLLDPDSAPCAYNPRPESDLPDYDDPFDKCMRGEGAYNPSYVFSPSKSYNCIYTNDKQNTNKAKLQINQITELPRD